MSKYSLSLERLLSLVPLSLRKVNFINLVHCLLIPVSYLHMIFTQYREKKEYRLAHNGQVYSLTKVICDFCGNNDCKITDGTYIEEVFLPTNAEGELIHHQVSFPSDINMSPSVLVPSMVMSQFQQADFIVHLPQVLYGHIDEAGLRALIDEYKLAGKQYFIVYDDVIIEHYIFSWSEDICVLELEPTQETYNFEWQNPICILDASFEFQWLNNVCVKDIPYGFEWSVSICVKEWDSDHYQFSWFNTICITETSHYSYSWSNSICRQVDDVSEERE